jgi:hypothetical protein
VRANRNRSTHAARGQDFAIVRDSLAPCPSFRGKPATQHQGRYPTPERIVFGLAKLMVETEDDERLSGDAAGDYYELLKASDVAG